MWNQELEASFFCSLLILISSLPKYSFAYRRCSGDTLTSNPIWESVFKHDESELGTSDYCPFYSGTFFRYQHLIQFRARRLA